MQIATLCAAWKSRLAADTRYTYHQNLKAILRMLGRPDLADVVPRLKWPNNHPPAATPDEIARLLAVASPPIRAAIIIARDTGMRRSDLLALAPAHVKDGLITITMQKTKRELRLPASPAILELIASLPAADPITPIVDTIYGRHMKFAAFSRGWTRAKKQAGVNPFLKPHSLRHSVAVSLYEISRDLRAVQQVLGHERLSSTVGYLEHADPHKLTPLLREMWSGKPKGPVQ